MNGSTRLRHTATALRSEPERDKKIGFLYRRDFFSRNDQSAQIALRFAIRSQVTSFHAAEQPAELGKPVCVFVLAAPGNIVGRFRLGEIRQLRMFNRPQSSGSR
jgi:hypothetical protein